MRRTKRHINGHLLSTKIHEYSFQSEYKASYDFTNPYLAFKDIEDDLVKYSRQEQTTRRNAQVMAICQNVMEYVDESDTCRSIAFLVALNPLIRTKCSNDGIKSAIDLIHDFNDRLNYKK